MYIFQKYIIKQLLLTISVITGIITSIVCTTQLLSMLYLFDKGISFSHFLWLVALIIPSLLFIVLPLTVTLSVIYLYQGLEHNRHLIILRTIGLNDFTIMKPALLVAMFMMFCSYFISVYMMPASQMILRNNLHSLKENYISSLIKENSFNQASKYINIYVGRKLQQGQYENLIIFDSRNSQNSVVHLAKYGTFKEHNGNPIFIINQGFSQFYDQNHKLVNLSFNTLLLELNNNDQPNNYNKRMLAEYFISELLNPDETLHNNRKFKMISEGHQRLIWPLYTFVLPFSVLGLALRLDLKRKKTYLLVTGFILLVMYVHFVAQNFALNNLNFVNLMYLNVVILLIMGQKFYRQKSFI